MADRLEIMLELERRGKLPPEKAEVLGELRKRGKIPSLETSSPEDLVSMAGKKIGIKQTIENFKKPIPVFQEALPALGAAGGLAATGMNPLGGVAGYYAGKQLSRASQGKIGTPSQQIGDINEGMLQEVAGPIIQKVAKPIGWAAKKVGKGISQALGSTTGAGPGMAEEAVKGSPAFTQAMRGKVDGEEIVENVKNAFNTLKENRASAYREQLANVTQNRSPIDISSLKQRVINNLAKFKIGFKADGGLDFSNSHLPKKAAAEVEQAFDDILRWDQNPENVTAIGLDTLKRRLGNYYAENSAARSMIADLESETKKLILREVPEYASMTKGYSEATKLIKDIETTLMAGNKYKADQTLRRLTSAMRENFEMRKDLLKVLGEKTGDDLAGQVAGYSASQVIPRGLVGKLAGGGAGYITFLNPKFWPLLAASSPRAVGEFLNLYGMALRQSKAVAPATYRTLAIGAAQGK